MLLPFTMFLLIAERAASALSLLLIEFSSHENVFEIMTPTSLAESGCEISVSLREPVDEPLKSIIQHFWRSLTLSFLRTTWRVHCPADILQRLGKGEGLRWIPEEQ